MNQETFKQIQETAKKFADTAKRVNISSRLRTNHIREALACIIYLQSIESNVAEDLTNVAYKDNNKKEGDIYIKSMCERLKDEVGVLTKVTVDIQKSNNLDKNTLKKVIRLHNDFKTTISEIVKKLSLVIENDNEIIKKDEDIIRLKTTQQNFLDSLYTNTQKSCVDAVRAVKGSKSNLIRGLKMVQNFEQIETLIESNDLDALTILFNNTKVGWEIAENVNQSSTSQLKFAEKVYDNTQMLHEQSKRISNLVNTRTDLYMDNVYSINFITKLMTEQIIKHEFLDELFSTFDSLSQDEHISNLAERIRDITKNAEGIIRQNIQNSYYSENETGTFEMIKEENSYYDKIIEEIEFMTETTHYPIEGSKANIHNGQLLEKLLVEVLNEIGIPVQLSQ